MRLAVRRARLKHEQEYLVYAAVTRLGYGTIENVLVTYASIQNKETGGMIALTLLERIIFASMGRTIMALLRGLQSIRRDAQGEMLSIWQVIAREAAYHRTWGRVLFVVSVWNGNVGWIHPTDAGSIAVASFSVLALRLKAARDVYRQLGALQLKVCASMTTLGHLILIAHSDISPLANRSCMVERRCFCSVAPQRRAIPLALEEDKLADLAIPGSRNFIQQSC